MRINPDTRGVIISSGIIISPLLAFGCQAASQKTNPSPNVIYILADDLGIGDLGCYGQKLIKTPAIDSLAANGVRFTQHYSGSTVSAPSRCVLLTGKHSGHAYIRGNKGSKHADGVDYDLSLAKNEITVAEIFKQKQYQTACIGKWGLGGPGSQGHPNNQGFDYFFGYLGQGLAHKYYPKQLYENNSAVPLDGKTYSHDLIMEKALDFVSENASKPFFLYLTPTIPHAELIVPEGELMGYDGQFFEKPFVQKSGSYCSQPKPRATFAAMVSRLDRDVQRLVDLLDEKGILNNTLIIFTSDNGTHKEGGHDPEFFDSNGPFRGYKRDLYEGGIRTPHIAYWPGVIPKASVSYHISAFWDFLPTMADLIGVKIPEGVDGISYLPTLTGKGKQKQHASLYFEFHEQGGRQAIMKDGWKLIRLNVSTPQKSTLELYNYFEDPGEMANVAAQYPEKVKELTVLMDSQRTKDDNWNFVKK
jgi:arylsulfatase A-like enzyme